MPGVLVESSASSPHAFFPFESSAFSNGGFDGNGGFDVSSPRADLAPLSPHSPLSTSHFPLFDGLGSSPPSPSYRTRELAQRLLPKSNLGLALNCNFSEPSLECAAELTGVPIPSPRKSLYNNCSADSMVGSPLLSDSNGMGSPVFSDAFSALHKFLPSNTNDDDSWPADAFPAMDAYSCDDFRMYEFKVRRCMRGRSHDWTECPFAHPGEKARRRDPRRIHYSGTACPDFRKGCCKRGDACEYAHGVFECWLHPARYRTQPCKDGRACRRRVCFFAHTVEQLRVLPSASSAVSTSSSGAGSPRKSASLYDTSSFRQGYAVSMYNDNASESMSTKEDRGPVVPRLLQKALESKGFGGGAYSTSSSPTSTLPPYHTGSPPGLSPPLSPSTSPPMSPDFWPRNLTCPQSHVQSPLSNVSSIPEHRRHLNRLQTMPTISIPSEVSDFSVDAAKFDDMPFTLPASAHVHSPHGGGVSELLHSLQTLQLCSRIAELQRSVSTPSSPQSFKYPNVQHSPLRQCLYRSIPGTPASDGLWDFALDSSSEVDPPLRVESGRDLRARIYARIGKENGVECNEDPDLGWVNELVK
ncbi:hypothetical protein L7F22_055411 [Adiantum nelumboides]|nr:hypothetical protein [Adiantum nelumboides]